MSAVKPKQAVDPELFLSYYACICGDRGNLKRISFLFKQCVANQSLVVIFKEHFTKAWEFVGILSPTVRTVIQNDIQKNNLSANHPARSPLPTAEFIDKLLSPPDKWAKLEYALDEASASKAREIYEASMKKSAEKKAN